MIKKKKFSAYNDFKTGILYKISISLGIIFLIIFIFLKIISQLSINNTSIELLKYFYDLSLSDFPGLIISFSILLLSFGLILYFFKRQFLKLAKIADEIEHGEEDKK